MNLYYYAAMARSNSVVLAQKVNENHRGFLPELLQDPGELFRSFMRARCLRHKASVEGARQAPAKCPRERMKKERQIH